MTIRKGEEWGRPSCAESVVTVVRDCDLADAILLAKQNLSELQVQGGDTWLSLGRPRLIKPPDVCWQLSFDAIRVTLIGQTLLAYSSVVLRRPWWRGGFLAGSVWCVSLTGIVRGRNITPRAHANDGLIDVLRVSDSMKSRQRIQAWSRASRGDHLPHDGIDVTRTQFIQISFPQDLLLTVDGKRQGRVREVHLEVLSDEWTVSVPRIVSNDDEASQLGDDSL